MTEKSVKSVFRRLALTYVESPMLKEWIIADPSNPLNQISQLIDHGEVLDIGCGTGILGRLLEGKPNVYVDGIDPAIDSDHDGVQGYRQFYPLKIEQLFESQGVSRYDWFVLADVIEHFAYPDEVLASIAARAKPSARFLISTPNIAHLSVRLNLLQGRFDYSESGILESTHLRFFTLRTFQQVIESAGLSFERVLLLNRLPGDEEMRESGWFRTLITIFLAPRDSNLFTYQFLAIARVGSGARMLPFEQIGPRSIYGRCFHILKSALLKLKPRLRKSK